MPGYKIRIGKLMLQSAKSVVFYKGKFEISGIRGSASCIKVLDGSCAIYRCKNSYGRF